MLMVIFGAGASYDSLADVRPPDHPNVRSDVPFRPPLAKQLFERRGIFDTYIEQYYECGPIVPRLRRLPEDSNFERELEKLQAQAADYPHRYVQLHAIRYYLRRIIWKCTVDLINDSKSVTNYADLVDRIAYWLAKHPGEEVRFVTFNYDTLLERACETALGIYYANINAYVQDSYKLYKPHGSVNWVRTVKNNPDSINRANPEHSIIGLGNKLDLESADYRVRHPDTSPIQDDGQYAYPALALPVEAKSDFECPTEHLTHLKVDIGIVTKLLIIGWRATEAHFLDLWKKHRTEAIPKTAIVAGNLREAQQVEQNLRGAGIVGPTHLSQGGFSAFVSGPEVGAFLDD